MTSVEKFIADANDIGGKLIADAYPYDTGGQLIADANDTGSHTFSKVYIDYLCVCHCHCQLSSLCQSATN